MTRRVHHEPRPTPTVAPVTGPVELPSSPSLYRGIALHTVVLTPAVACVVMLAYTIGTP